MRFSHSIEGREPRSVRLLRVVRCAIPCIAALCIAGSLSAEESTDAVPSFTTFQGRLVDRTGEPVARAGDVAIRIWSSEFDEEARSLLYEEVHPGVELVGGLLTLPIGRGQPTQGSYDEALRAGVPVWVELEIEGEVLAPRLRLAAAPYAKVAERALEATNIGGVSVTQVLRNDTDEVFSGPSLTIAGTSGLVIEGAFSVQSREGMKLGVGDSQAQIGFAQDLDAIESDKPFLVPDIGYKLAKTRYYQLAGNVFLADVENSSPQRTDWQRSGGYGYALDRDDTVHLYAPVHLPSEAHVTDFRCYAMKDSFGESRIEYGAVLTGTRRPARANVGGGTLATLSAVVSQEPQIFGSGETQEDIGTVVNPYPVIDNETTAYYVRVAYVETSHAGGGGPGFGNNRFYGCRIGYLVFKP